RAGLRTLSGVRSAPTATPAAGSAPRSRARYPPTPATATTTPPITSPARERLGRLLAPVAGSGVVGAPVIWVGASAAVLGSGRGAPRLFVGAATGCSGHAAVAHSSRVALRWSGSFAQARQTAAQRASGTRA